MIGGQASMSWKLMVSDASKVGGLEVEQVLRMAPINGCKMEERWLLN